MRDKQQVQVGLLAWLILPLLVIWLSMGYVIGLTKRVDWSKKEERLTRESFGGSMVSRVRAKGFGSVLGGEEHGGGLVTLWFDDAWESQFSNTLEAMSEKGWVGVLAVPTDMVGVEGYMQWHEVQRLAYDGWEIASHGMSHDCELATDELGDFELELIGSKKEMERRGLIVDHYVAPCGTHSDLGDELVHKYYSSQRLTLRGINQLPLFDEFRLKVEQVDIETTTEKLDGWITATEEMEGWLNLMFHQVDDEGGSLSVSTSMFRDILDRLEQSNLKVVTATEALEVAGD